MSLADIPAAPPPSPTSGHLNSNQEHWVDAQELLASALEHLALTFEEVVIPGKTADLAAIQVEERSAAARKRWKMATKRVVSAAATLKEGSGGNPDEGREKVEEEEAEGQKYEDSEEQGEDDEGRGKRKRRELSPRPDLDRVRRPRR
jgi:hypothetical protein